MGKIKSALYCCWNDSVVSHTHRNDTMNITKKIKKKITNKESCFRSLHSICVRFSVRSLYCVSPKHGILIGHTFSCFYCLPLSPPLSLSLVLSFSQCNHVLNVCHLSQIPNQPIFSLFFASCILRFPKCSVFFYDSKMFSMSQWGLLFVRRGHFYYYKYFFPEPKLNTVCKKKCVYTKQTEFYESLEWCIQTE